MKKLFTMLWLLLLAAPAFTQNKSDIVIQNACKCLEGYNAEGQTYEQLTQKLGTCVASDLITYYAELKEEFGITETDYSRAMEQIGEQLGARMALQCPKLMDISLKMAQENEEFRQEVLDNIEFGDSREHITFTGTVEKVKAETITGITVNSGEESLYFVWLNKFPGSEEFEKDPESLKGKKVTVTYYEMSIYDGSSKTYVKKKIISRLAVN